MKRHVEKLVEFGVFNFVFNIRNLNHDSHEKWELVVNLLICDVNFVKKSRATVFLENFSNFFIDNLISDFVMLAHDNERVFVGSFSVVKTIVLSVRILNKFTQMFH